MRVIGSRIQHRVSMRPSGEALKTAAEHQVTALALAAVATTGMRRGLYRFATLAQANAHAEEAFVRAIVENARALKMLG